MAANSDNSTVELFMASGDPVVLKVAPAEAQRIANQIQRRVKGEEATQVRFVLSDEPGHYLVLDSSQVVAMLVTPAP